LPVLAGVKSALGLYVPVPLTATGVPSCVPPVVQLLGGLACGPNTVNVIVPPAPAVAFRSAEVIELAGTAEPAVAADGPEAVTLSGSLTTVEAMELPQPLFEALLFVSPL
jgi:hypothetical protein